MLFARGNVYKRETINKLNIKTHPLDRSVSDIVDKLGTGHITNGFKRTHRGCQAGQKTHKKSNQNDAVTEFQNKNSNISIFKYELLNVRSIRNKTEIVHDLIIDNNFDCLAITETWLSPSAEQSDIINSCSDGYSFLHCAQPQSKGGGGNGFLYKCSISVKEVTNDKFRTFEHQDFLLKLRASTVCVIVLYGPPPSATNGFTFSSCINLVTI